MKAKQKIGLVVLLLALIVAVTGWYLRGHTVDVLQPAGQIGSKERNLIIFCALLSVTVVVPVFALLGFIAYRYREGNTKAKYSPELSGNRVAETVWWLIPTALLLIISVVNWRSSYALDPFKPLAVDKPTMHIQVVALDWKWLFIYPQQNVASVGYVYIPVGTPVDFEITSDTVMTSFWVPQLGGQMYAMPGMETQLNLQASKAGKYNGVAANISGTGFASQKFTVAAVQPQLFPKSVSAIRASGDTLDSTSYTALAKPSVLTSPRYYGSVAPGLFNDIVMRYMMPLSSLPKGSSTL